MAIVVAGAKENVSRFAPHGVDFRSITMPKSCGHPLPIVALQRQIETRGVGNLSNRRCGRVHRERLVAGFGGKGHIRNGRFLENRRFRSPARAAALDIISRRRTPVCATTAQKLILAYPRDWPLLGLRNEPF